MSTYENYGVIGPAQIRAGGSLIGGIYTINDQLSVKTSASWIDNPAVVQYLIVAGGAGSVGTGGGGAGGLLSDTINIPRGVNIQVTVGSGGVSGEQGSNSFLLGGPIYIIALGGGSGGSYGNQNGLVGVPGGSGGGGGSGELAGATTTSGGAGTPGQGNAGGYATRFVSPGNYAGGGGGGAGGAGDNAVSGSRAGNGGVGLESSITGSPVFYAGGGGGAIQYASTPANRGLGGNGGGGNGASTQSTNANSLAYTDGTPNTGGGGGGRCWSNNISSNGGSGIVILRTPVQAITTTGSPIITQIGDDFIYKFISSGSITF